MATMQLVEQHIIDRRDPRWAAVDNACLQSKNLYNAANFIIRQEYITHQRYISYTELASRMKRHPDFCALPRKVSQQVLMQLDRAWRGFFTAHSEWEQHPEKFPGRPELPRYKHKTDGRNLLIYTVQAISHQVFKQKGVIRPSQLDIQIETRQKALDQVRIVPRKSCYVVEIVYTIAVQDADVDPDRVASIDI